MPYGRTYYYSVPTWYETQNQDGGYQRYEWIFTFDESAYERSDDRVTGWSYYLCDAYGNILPGEQIRTVGGFSTTTITTQVYGSPSSVAGLTKYVRAKPTLQYGTADWSEVSAPLTASGVIDHPFDYRDYSGDMYTYHIETPLSHAQYNYGGNDLNGVYEPVKTGNDVAMLFNGEPIWRRTNLATSDGVVTGNANIDPCIVLLMYQRPMNNPNRYGTIWWHHWVFCEWSDIVSLSGYPNFPDPLAAENNDGYNYWPTTGDDQGITHLVGNAPYINDVYLPYGSEGILSVGDPDLAKNGAFDSWTRKHPGLFAIGAQVVKTYDRLGNHIMTTTAGSDGALSHTGPLF